MSKDIHSEEFKIELSAYAQNKIEENRKKDFKEEYEGDKYAEHQEFNNELLSERESSPDNDVIKDFN